MLLNSYLDIKKVNNLPRLPFEGRFDITYRCNNNCRHCWLRISPDSADKKEEITFKEIKCIADEARVMGCRAWSISGGEPMLRPDFLEILDYLSANSNSYLLNTNGTLITPKISRLMKRRGTKMVSLYGATADVHDNITRNPGSFEATMRGFRYLKEAGAGFIVQITLMKDNYHQLKEMFSLAGSLSKHYRTGAGWLYLSASGDKTRNREIMRQRLPPQEAVALNNPDLFHKERIKNEASYGCGSQHKDGYFFASCVNRGRSFHIDPYSKMTFCIFIKDPDLRYDLKNGSFKDGWEKFIPSLATKIKINEGYKKSCGSCKYRKNCWTCPVFSYLEHRRLGKKINYLCSVAQENKKFEENWLEKHRRYFRIADLTIQVDSDLPIQEETFHPKFNYFKVDGPCEDTITIRHHFTLPDFNGKDLGKELYRQPPWAVYKKGDSWIYLGISPTRGDKNLHRVAVFNSDYTRATIYNQNERHFQKGNLGSLTIFPTDQVLLARILADRQGCILHAGGVIFEGKGLLFVGHSGAGKSTIVTMLRSKAEILCDDRIILKRLPTSNRQPQNGFRIYGTWSHGDVPDVSAHSAPLKAIMFLEKAKENRLVALEDKKEITKRILSCMIKPFVDVDWWEKTLSLLDKIAQEAPCYVLKFNKSGRVLDTLRKL